MLKLYREAILLKIATLVWFSSICIWSIFNVRQFPEFVVLFSILSLFLIWRAFVLFYGIKIDNGEIFITRFRQWRKVRPEEVSIVNVENESIEIYMDKLNIFGRASIPIKFSSKDRPQIITQVQSILGQNPEIKILIEPEKKRWRLV
jgi:hypothetical protein